MLNSFGGVSEDVVGRRNRLETLFGMLIAGVEIRMILFRKSIERVFYLFRGGASRQLERGVRILPPKGAR